MPALIVRPLGSCSMPTLLLALRRAARLVAAGSTHRPLGIPLQVAVLCGIMAMFAILCWLEVEVLTWRAIDVEAARLISLLIFALAVNAMVTATIWFADFFAGFSLPSAYYEIRKFERSGKLYENLGIRMARRIFRHSPAVRFSGRRASFSQLELDMRLAETHHALSLIVIVPVAICILAIGPPSLTLNLLIFAVVLQVYPILLQRYNRNRLLKLSQVSTSNAAGAVTRVER